MPKEYGTPGPRAIYPDICTSRSIAACSVEAQLLFDRLLAQADDQGRIEGDALVIKTLCVPLVESIPARGFGRGSKRVRGVDELLAELEAEDLVHVYRSGRAVLVQVITWWRWQQGMRRAYPSRWPSPEGWTDAVYGHGAGSAATYKAWLSAAERGTAPHNAAWRGELPHNGAIGGGFARAGGAQPPAEAGADSGASTVPDSPQPPAGGGRPSRANGTNQRAVEAERAAAKQAAEEARTWRRRQRQLAYYRGALTEGQLRDQNDADAPLEDIPDWAEYQAALSAEAEPFLPVEVSS